MVTSLHELTKQLDALTYNSRSVLNALIRSVLSAGSSDGYEVVRGGETIRLTRVDIYHLYTLYQEWNARIGRNGSTVDDEGVVSFGLPDLVAELDTDYQSENGDTSKTPYKDAVVKHSKILYMNSDNLDNTDDEWILLVDRSSNPKMVTNSAPIPINIRTPIYDENLSTKHFSPYETYLFPRGYYTLDAMGAYGDGMTHNAGGHKWLFDIDSVFQVKSPLSVFGVQDNKWIKQLPDNYGKDKSYSLVVGDNSFVYGANSFIAGRWNQTIGKYDAILGGSGNHVYGDYASAIGGNDCNIVGESSSAGGSFTIVGGDYSFAYGYGSSVGGHAYPFYMGVNINDGAVIEPNTDCATEFTVNGCTYQLVPSSNTSNNTNESTSRNIGANEIYINADDVAKSGIGYNNIPSGDRTIMDYLDFKVGDSVYLYRFQPSGSGNDNTYPISNYLDAKVTGITRHMNSSRTQVYGYIVTLDKSVYPSHNLGTSSGLVIRNNANYYNSVGSDGVPVDGTVNLETRFSASIGIRTIAAGQGQVVVGAQNRELLRPNFIVGIGRTDYIDPAERYNGLVVAPHYNYMTVRAEYIAAGMSTFTTAENSNHSMLPDSAVADARKYDEDNVEKYSGYYAYADNKDRSIRALLRVFNGYSGLLVNNSGIDIFVPKESDVAETGLYQDIVATRISGGSTGAVLISDTTGADLDSLMTATKAYFLMESTAKNSVVIEGKSQAVLSSSQLTVVHGNVMQIAGNKLQFAFTSDNHIDHTTYGSLVAYPAASGNNPTGFNYYDKNIYKLIAYYGNELGDGWNTVKEVGTGFYYMNGTGCLPGLMTGYNNLASSYHALNSSRMISNANDGKTQYSVAQLILPGYVETGASQHGQGSQLAHPVFVSSLVETNNPNNYSANEASMESGRNYICEELAYMSDLISLKQSSQTIYDWIRPAYATLNTSKYYRLSWTIKTVQVNGTSVVSWAEYVEAMADTSPFIDDMCKVISNQVRPTVDNCFLNQVVNKDVYYSTNVHSLNTVAINPASFIKFHNALNGDMIYSMVAFSPMQLGVTDEDQDAVVGIDEYSGLPYLTTSYARFATATEYGAKLIAGLSATPFSSMVSYDNQSANDKAAAVWVIMKNNKTENKNVQWVRIIENLIVVFQNGHLTITFDLHPIPNDNNYLLPKYTSYDVTQWSWGSTYLDGLTSFDFYIPFAPDKVGKLNHLVNPATGVPLLLRGQAYYTGDSNSFASAALVNINDFGIQQHVVLYDYPAIKITVAGFNLTAGQPYHYEIQGDVAYAE